MLSSNWTGKILFSVIKRSQVPWSVRGFEPAIHWSLTLFSAILPPGPTTCKEVSTNLFTAGVWIISWYKGGLLLFISRTTVFLSSHQVLNCVLLRGAVLIIEGKCLHICMCLSSVGGSGEGLIIPPLACWLGSRVWRAHDWQGSIARSSRSRFAPLGEKGSDVSVARGWRVKIDFQWHAHAPRSDVGRKNAWMCLHP